MSSSKQSVIIIEQNVILRKIYASLLRKLDFKVRVFSSLSKSSEYPDWILLSESSLLNENKIKDKLITLKKHNVSLALLKETNQPNPYIEHFEVTLSLPLQEDNLEKLKLHLFKQEIEIFNKEEFEKEYRDSSFRNEIIKMFLNDENTSEKALINAFSTKDSEQIHVKVHYLKGSLVYLKAGKLLELTQKAVNLCRENRLEEVLNMQKTIINERRRLVKALKEYMTNE